MPDVLLTFLLWAAVLGCGTMAGVYFAFSAFVLAALGGLGQPGMLAMNAINRIILRSAFMPLFWGSTLLALVLAVAGATGWPAPPALALVAGGLAYLLGMFGVTALCNVPLNTALGAVDADAPGAAALWDAYRRRWLWWNHLRTAACLLACGCFLAVLSGALR